MILMTMNMREDLIATEIDPSQEEMVMTEGKMTIVGLMTDVDLILMREDR